MEQLDRFGERPIWRKSGHLRKASCIAKLYMVKFAKRGEEMNRGTLIRLGTEKMA